MKWLDYSTVLVINTEGVEKIINVDLDFKEVAYNLRPLFDDKDIEEFKDYAYFFER